jgi:hypothetical protein
MTVPAPTVGMEYSGLGDTGLQVGGIRPGGSTVRRYAGPHRQAG